MKFKWRDEHPLMYPTDSNDGFFRLPKYVVSFVDNKNIQKVNYGDGEWPQGETKELSARACHGNYKIVKPIQRIIGQRDWRLRCRAR